MLNKLHLRNIFSMTLLFSLIFLSSNRTQAQWAAVRYDSTNIFLTAFAVTANTVFAIGTEPQDDEYFLVRTNDGGMNWDSISIGAPNDTVELNTLFFLDVNTGFTGGKKNSHQLLMKTNDNGNTWTDITPNPASLYNISSIYFIDSQNGFAINDIALYKTTNGGMTWTTETPAFTPRDLYFFDMNNGLSSGSDALSNAVVMKTSDGGQTWINVLSAFNSNLGVNSFNKLDFVNSGLGFASWEYSDKLYQTQDGGLSWNPLDVDSITYVGDFDFTTADTGHAIGVIGSGQEFRILLTVDGGQTWTMEYTTGWDWYGTGVIINSISFAEQTGYTAASRGLIKKYTPNLTGIKEEDLSEEIRVYPNPATNKLIIENGELQIEEVEIYSLLGEKVYSQSETHNQKPITVSVPDLPSGIYFVKLRSGAGERVVKLVKE